MYKDARIAPALRPLKDDCVGDIANTLWVLMGTIGIVMLIACANVANLLLVRAEGRQQELAVRAALGAGRGRIARELLVESVAARSDWAALLGLALAYAAHCDCSWHRVRRHCRAWTRLRSTRGRSRSPSVVSLFSGLSVRPDPGVQVRRGRNCRLVLRGGGRSLSSSRDRQRTRNVLVVVQVALALVLLVSSGLMIRTFQALRHVDPGFYVARQLQTVRISIPDTSVKEPEHVIRMHEAILRKVEALPGVTSVGLADSVPMEGGWGDPLYAEDKVYAEGTIPPLRRFRIVSPGYVASIGSRLIAGRDITWNETYSHVPVALISENMARELWRDPQAALGKRIRPTLKDDWREVVGVIADLRDNGVDQKAPTTVYWPLYMNNFESDPVYVRRGVSILIRSARAGSLEFLGEVRRAVWAVNPNLPVANPQTLGNVYDRSMARTSFTLVMLVIAGGMALLLGIVGIYGVLSYSVSQRTREIGIRLALGAPLGNVRGMFLRHGLMLSGIGAACGLTAAFALTRLMKTLLFEVSPADPVTYVAASAGLVCAAMLASYLPARSASAVDPAHALRGE